MVVPVTNCTPLSFTNGCPLQDTVTKGRAKHKIARRNATGESLVGFIDSFPFWEYANLFLRVRMREKPVFLAKIVCDITGTVL